MLGTYRFILASIVIIGHLWIRTPGMHYAVGSFYIISGFLMTAILHERYGFAPKGLGKYFANRALRIYPTYLIIVGLTLLIVILYPWLPWQVSRYIFLPESLPEWSRNLLIFGMTATEGGRLIPQAWSLDVELWFYLLMALVLSRRQESAVIWLELSLIWTITAIWIGLDFDTRQRTFFAGSLPFSLGANIWFIKDKLSPVPLTAFICLSLLFIANLIYCHLTWIDPWMEGQYISILISAFTLIALVKTEPIKSYEKIDKLLGDLSYPMYVSHLLVGCAVILAFFPGTPRHRGPDFFIIAFGYTLLFSYILHRYIERPVETLRARIKRAKVPRKEVKPTAAPPE
jgi:peptidoglycan/LPS O-acetylase OafA/YrhL